MTVEFGLILTVCSVTIGVLGYLLNKKNQQINQQNIVEQNAKSDGKMEATLNHISRGIDDIRIDVKSNKEQLNTFAKDLVRVEESVASAHKRIDEINKK